MTRPKRDIESLLKVFQRVDVVPAPSALAQFIAKRFADLGYADESEPQHEPRYRIIQPITVVEIDKKLQPAGEPFRAITRDVSVQNVAFLHTRAISEPLLALKLDLAEGKFAVFVARLETCTQIGRFYDIVVQLDARLRNLEEQLGSAD